MSDQYIETSVAFDAAANAFGAGYALGIISGLAVGVIAILIYHYQSK